MSRQLGRIRSFRKDDARFEKLMLDISKQFLLGCQSYYVECTLYSCKNAVTDAACKDWMIAIEFDGPTHFLRDVHADHEKGRIENGPTQAKRRFLERLGWTVINIPYWEWWDKAKTKKGRKVESNCWPGNSWHKPMY
jgi:very-short-patch-repair endonuclease